MSAVFPPVGGGLASSAALSAVQTDVDSIQTVTDTKVAGRGQCSLATIDLTKLQPAMIYLQELHKMLLLIV